MSLAQLCPSFFFMNLMFFLFIGTVAGMFQDYVTKSEVNSRWQCTICGKESAQKVNLVKHIEAVHFPDSFSHECRYCGLAFNSKNKMYMHVQKSHKN